MNALALLLAFSVSTTVPAEPCDAACERLAAESRITNRDFRAAIERLRVAVDRFPDDPSLALLLARAYVLDGNLFWAEQTLRAALVARPDDVEARAWLVLVHLRQGDPDLARDALDAVRPSPAGAEHTRLTLLTAYQSSLVGDDDAARAALKTLDRNAPVFPEDRQVLDILRRRVEPGWIPPVSGQMEMGLGKTSNALAGSPTDPGASGNASALLDGLLQVRIAPDLSPSVRPVLDLETDGRLVLAQEYREFSSLEASARFGALVSRGRYRILVGYRAEVLNLDQQPSRFSDASRGEIEIESSSGWVLFGGGGHREYRDERRTRDEWDAGGGIPLRFGSGRSMIFGATIRGASATSPAYDLLGASIAAASRFSLPRGHALRVSGTVSWDDYPDSGGAEGLVVFGTEEKRSDLTGKLTVGIWLPHRRGVTAALEAQVARRDSTADARPGFDFDYTEYRVGILLRIGFSGDPAGPRVVDMPGRVPLEWGLGPGEASEAERIMELLRQDEDLRRGSSCGI
jgi:tetratricopeptide (TPR) repeat protein